MTDGKSTQKHPSFVELDALSTEELRERAFSVARHRGDVKFFYSIFELLPHARPTSQLEESLGSFGSAIEDAIELWYEFTGHGYGDQEPMIRAAFIEYLQKRG